MLQGELGPRGEQGHRGQQGEKVTTVFTPN
jgi:hypothetical protein